MKKSDQGWRPLSVPAGYDTKVIDVSDIDTDDITAEIERALADCVAPKQEQRERRRRQR